MSDMDKYKSLVQPIQDLVLNWDIDVAEGLTDYLEELDAIRIRTTSEEGEDGPTLNFAQAAILIQGSTAVYSKKVEYLHKLVYQALEYFSQQRDNKSSRAAGSDGEKVHNNPRDDVSFFMADPDLLLLDDVLDEPIIALSKQSKNGQKSIDMDVSQKQTHNELNDMDENAYFGKENQSNSHSTSQSILMRSLLQVSQPSGNGSGLRMQSCAVDSISGGLMLVGGAGDAGNSRRSGERRSASYESRSARRSRLSLEPEYSLLPPTSQLPMPDDQFDNNNDNNFPMELDDGDNDGGCADGFDDHIDGLNTFAPTNPTNLYNTRSTTSMALPVDASGIQSTFTNPEPLALARGSTNLLDPHSNEGAGGGDSRMVKKGSHCRRAVVNTSVPISFSSTSFDRFAPHSSSDLSLHEPLLDFLGLVKEKESSKSSSTSEPRASKLEQFIFQDLVTCFPSTFYHSSSTAAYTSSSSRLPNNKYGFNHKLVRPTPSSLDQLRQKRLGSMVEGRQSKLAEKESSKEAHSAGTAHPGAHPGIQNMSDAQEYYQYDDGDDGLGAPMDEPAEGGLAIVSAEIEKEANGYWFVEDGTHIAQDEDAEGSKAVLGTQNVDAAASGQDAPTDEVLDTWNGEGLVAVDGGELDEEVWIARRVEAALNDSLSTQATSSYEVLCRQHIQKFLLGAENYAMSSQLTKRVTEWTLKLEPLLVKEEAAPPYDIKIYKEAVQDSVRELVLNKKKSKSTSGDGQWCFSDVIGATVDAMQGSGKSDEQKQTSVSITSSSEKAISRSEVGRCFLACLQLVNDKKVDILPGAMTGITDDIPMFYLTEAE